MFSTEMEIEMEERLRHYQEIMERKLTAREGRPARPVSWVIQQNQLRYDEHMNFIDGNGRMGGWTGWRNTYHRRVKRGGGPRIGI